MFIRLFKLETDTHDQQRAPKEEIKKKCPYTKTFHMEAKSLAINQMRSGQYVTLTCILCYTNRTAADVGLEG